VTFFKVANERIAVLSVVEKVEKECGVRRRIRYTKDRDVIPQEWVVCAYADTDGFCGTSLKRNL
jgi:hypothetical protein